MELAATIIKEFGTYLVDLVTYLIIIILEYCMLDRLDAFLKKFQIITFFKRSFRTGKSISMALIEFYNHVLESIENRKSTRSIFSDLRKVVDCST